MARRAGYPDPDLGCDLNRVFAWFRKNEGLGGDMESFLAFLDLRRQLNDTLEVIWEQ